VIIVDPFIKSHQLKENDNDDIEFAVGEWNRVA
jgi:hypothetical protein